MGIAARLLRAFHGGVHPEERKNLSEQCAIETMPLPEQLYVPLHQHIGAPCEPCVSPGSHVDKGEVIGRAEGFVSAAVHAPTSGLLVDFVDRPAMHPSGLSMLCALIEPDGTDHWLETLQAIEDPFTMPPQQLRDRIRDAGVVGLGGATFPSFIKLSRPKGKAVELLIINGVECEPYLTCDARLMEECAADIVAGIAIMLHALWTKRCIIAIEENKPAAIRAMQQAIVGHADMEVRVLPVRYPQGAEKQLIEVLTSRQVPSGGLPVDVGVIVHNVGTAVAIRDAVLHGKPLISRIVTVTGEGVVRPANVRVLIGTPLRTLVDHCGGLKPGVKKLISGGPMMGVALQSLDVPVVKGTSGVLALMDDVVVQQQEQACIRCGHCVEACPMRLMPCDMAWLARHDQFDTLQRHDLFDCIECGSCSYVCPAHIPLVHYFRYGKLSIQAQGRERRKAELAKARTQAREDRLAREKAERERKKLEMKAKASSMAAARAAAAAAAADQPAAPVAETSILETGVPTAAPSAPAVTTAVLDPLDDMVVEPGTDKASRAAATRARTARARGVAARAVAERQQAATDQSNQSKQ
ncbi:MAG: electron transport complex subunit RsxC [Magnetococcales bacterium]|nr:electron transport complex subunit RsxC [Magnetococcales bacterium]